MSTREKYLSLLRTFDDPALSAVCRMIGRDEDLSFLRDLRKVCQATPDGWGLAAPQIGVLKRAAFIWPGRSGYGLFMINPRIIAAYGDVAHLEEACLSYPGVRAIVARPSCVRIAWYDEHWNDREQEFRQLDARLVLHELDHLEGICKVGDAWRMRTRGRGMHPQKMIANTVADFSFMRRECGRSA